MNQTFRVPILVNILPRREERIYVLPLQITIAPAQTESQTITFGKLQTGTTATISTFPIEIDISTPIINSAFSFLNSTYAAYIDEDRELKTLLNYGEDRQSVILASRYGPVDTNGLQTIQVKLLDAIPPDVSTNSTVFLSREVAKTLIDNVRIKFAPEIDGTPYLRPKNLSARSNINIGKSVNNVTLNVLSLNSGSVGLTDEYKNISFEDQLFRKWYSYDFNSSELNIDFSDYSNFVFYGSAAMRLSAFKEKLRQLEKIEANRIQFLSSSTYVGNSGSAGFVFVQQNSAEFSKQKEDIIRGFDRYEQYLYFTPSGSNSPYSASAYYAENELEYNQYGYWPKNSSGSLYSVYSTQSVDWYTEQLAIAQRFDDFNENNLINTVPTYLREDDNSSAYITFVSMVGHFFDLIKPYIDQVPNIWSKNLNPNKQLSKDLLHEVAESFGFNLPTVDSIYNITDYVLGNNSEPPRRELTSEIYKRLLHNLTYFSKSKGTKSGLDSFLRTLGITPQLISIRESGVPVTGSYHVYDEYSTALDFDQTKQSYVTLPMVASTRSPRTLQFSCVVGKPQQMTVVTGDNRWALNVIPHPTNYTIGRFEIASGSSQIVILSSSYQEIYNDIPVSVTVDVAGSVSTLRVIQTEGEDVVFDSTMSETSSFSSLWNATQFAYVGGAGALVTNRFEGYVDEVRLWKDNLSSQTVLNIAFDPGSSAGDTYDAASEHLLIQLSFNNLNTALLAASSSINNETPYKNVAVAPSLRNIFAFNISGSDFSRYNRTIRQEMIQGGSSTYTTSKVNVAPSPVFISSDNGLRLYKNKSIVAPSVKKYSRGYNKIILSSSPTDIVNQNIIRVFGLENINALMGVPSKLYTPSGTTLDILRKHYQQYYNISVNKNRFIRIMSEVGEVLSQVTDYFVPAKSNLLKGVTIEPNVLEQVKIEPIKQIRVYGKNTRRTLSAPGSRSGSSPDYGATFNLSKTIDAAPEVVALGTLKTYKSRITDLTKEPNVYVTGKYTPASGSLHVPTMQLISKVDKLTTQLLATPTFLPESVNKLTTKLDGLVTTLSSSLSNLKTTLEKIPTNISSSYVTHKATTDVSIKQITGSYDVYRGLVHVTNDVELTSLYKTYNLKHIGIDLKGILEELSGSKLPSNADVGLNNMNKIPYNSINNGSSGAEPYNRIYSRKLFSSEITSTRNGGTASIYKPALYDIPPSADFRDFGVYTYFNKSTGIYYFPEEIKQPSYYKPLNITWDAISQSFNNVGAWSPGARYNIYDVVYQSIDNTYISSLGSDIVKSSAGGNGIYYVFKTKPSYTSPTNNTAFYSGSVPSYTPPSLDKQNWDVLRFTPSTRLVPKKVVFDIYTNSNLSQNNFKTTTIPVGRNIDNSTRYLDTLSIISIPANSSVTGELLLQNIAALLAVQSNFGGIRLRLYRTSDARNADVSRNITTRPTGSHGVLVDLEIPTANAAMFVNPFATLVADGLPPAGTLYYTINNLDTSDKISLSLLFYYFAIEIEPKIPRGYLRKHYRFFRDNSTATKRRNYEGCIFTIIGYSTSGKPIYDTIDGESPVQVFVSEGTDIVVNDSAQAGQIITGGGGQLNVT